MSLVNIHHYTKFQNSFLSMRTFKIYSLTTFKYAVLIIIYSNLEVVHYTPGGIYCITGNLYLLTLFPHFTHP